MAEISSGPQGSVAYVNAGGVMRFGAAAVSLGLLAGMAVWGYKLVVRDANGIPVVQAMAGPMREAPSNPGGELALNTGLTVNEVAADGGASGPGDVLVLAPQSAGLTEEDLLVQPTAEADEVRPAAIDVAAPEQVAAATPTSLGVDAQEPIAVQGEDAPMTADQILALADQITAGVDPLQALESAAVVAPTLSIDGAIVDDTQEAAVTLIAANVPGVATTFRPLTRPAGLAATPAVARASTNAIPTTPEVDVSAIEAVVAQAQTTTEVARAAPAPVVTGATLVQLGAFDTLGEAQEAWSELNGRFGDFMVGKDIVVQEAASGGAQFFRLRAQGFTDIVDARRFCSALVAEQAPCIPVVAQ